jgi:REP element-mobilizing transposase RayT
MANVYTQINIHAIFAVKGRHNILTSAIRLRVFEYITGILRNIDLFPLAVGGWQDHVHIFFELNPDLKISDLLKLVKANSSKWINENHLIKGKFEWQRGYGAFSYSRSQRDPVIKYILEQEEHHGKKGINFEKEYLALLEHFGIPYQREFLFEFLGD